MNPNKEAREEEEELLELSWEEQPLAASVTTE